MMTSKQRNVGGYFFQKKIKNLTHFLPLNQPDSWDEDEDGIWKRPKIPNPAYKGPWKRKVC